ncbi:ABC transporter I member 20 [Asimina triloba]
MDLLKPFKVLLLHEITVDLDVLARADLLKFLCKECEEQGATIIYAIHIFDGLDDWPSHIVYVAQGRLQLALPMEKVEEMSNLSLMRTVESWLRKERDEERKRRKERKAKGLLEHEKNIEGSRVVGDPARSAVRAMNNGWAGGDFILQWQWLERKISFLNNELKLSIGSDSSSIDAAWKQSDASTILPSSLCTKPK